MEPIETLNKMKDVLLENGWCTTYLQHSDGRVCLVGARNKVLGYSLGTTAEDNGYLADYVSDLIESVLPEEHRRQDYETDTLVWTFNDTAKSLNDVLDVLDEAIIAEKERNHGNH